MGDDWTHTLKEDPDNPSCFIQMNLSIHKITKIIRHELLHEIFQCLLDLGCDCADMMLTFSGCTLNQSDKSESFKDVKRDSQLNNICMDVFGKNQELVNTLKTF